MPLQPGARLGAYEIVGALGAGGMGEVYRARDTRLHRDVAIKILPDALTRDPEHLSRFEREAQLLASLNHPNVAQIHGVEDSDGMRSLVMEFVDGEDLAVRLSRGAMPIDDALRVALQIAHGLEAAHEHGIIHRDLKPANIKLRDDGAVKVLDFGLAKAIETDRPHAIDNSPTITSPAAMTRHGVILGTAAYMSPEQARGKPVDKRADIWAFGAVLYEMLAGKRAFDGETVSDTIAAVLKNDPDWNALPESTPFLVRRLLRHCLDKDSRQRLGDIRDARLEIAEAQTAVPFDVSTREPQRPQPRPWFAWAVSAVSLILLTLVATAWTLGIIGRLESPADIYPIRFQVPLPSGTQLVGIPAISPNGRHVVFSAAALGGGPSALWLRSADAAAARLLTERGANPFWAPDSERIGFFAGGKLQTMRLNGGPPTIVCDAPNNRGAAWNAADIIVFAPSPVGALYRVAATGGAPVAVTRIPAGEGAFHRWPQFLPDDRHFTFIAQSPQGFTTMIGSIDGMPPKRLIDADSAPAFAPPDTLLFARGGVLIAQQLDLATLNPIGEPSTVADGIGFTLGGPAQVSASSNGVLVARTGVPPRKVRLAWVDRAGNAASLSLPSGAYSDPSLSPDGRQIALGVHDASGDHVWVFDVARGSMGKRTFEGANTYPIWTRDGQFLTFTRGLNLFGPLMRIRSDGSGQAETLVSDSQLAGQKVASSWSADGRLLAFQSNQDVMIREADGTIKPALASPSAFEREGRFAPNGRWLAYRSNETGRDEVFVQSYPVGGGKWQISNEGGAQPIWAPKGNELFYKNGNRLMVVPVEVGDVFRHGAPHLLFEIPLPETSPGDPSRYAVTPDGKRFLVITTDTSEPITVPPIEILINWREELSQRKSRK